MKDTNDLTVLTRLLKMGWRVEGEFRDMRVFSLSLFGIRVTQSIAEEMLHKIGNESINFTSAITQQAMYELTRELYETLYEKSNSKSSDL